MLDVVILLISTSAAIAWLWFTGSESSERLPSYGVVHPSLFEHITIKLLPELALIADPFLLTATLAWLVIRFRGPLPRRRRWARQPGVAVGLVAILALIAGAAVTIRWGWDVHHSRFDWLDLCLIQLASSAAFGGLGVLVAWIGAALEGGWKPERSWIDRLGILLGTGWVLLGIPSWLLLKEHTMLFY